MSEKKIFCPCCGKHEQVQPVWYQVDKDEEQAFHAELCDYNVKPTPTGVEVRLPFVNIEGGPWNGDRFLVEYQADHYECKACNKMFAVQC